MLPGRPTMSRRVITHPRVDRRSPCCVEEELAVGQQAREAVQSSEGQRRPFKQPMPRSRQGKRGLRGKGRGTNARVVSPAVVEVT